MKPVEEMTVRKILKTAGGKECQRFDNLTDEGDCDEERMEALVHLDRKAGALTYTELDTLWAAANRAKEFVLREQDDVENYGR